MNLSFARTVEDWGKNIGKRPARAWMLSILWLLVITGIAFFWHLGSISLIDETEPLFAEASRQIIVTGDWITPYFNGETRFDKPILIYWLQALCYLIFGVNEWAVRLPSALSALAMTGLGFYTLHFSQTQLSQSQPDSHPLNRWLVAGLGATIIALNPEIMVWARMGVADMLLTACTVAALLCFFLGYAQPQHRQVQLRWYLAFYVLIALAILTKGPVGIVIPGLIIGAFLLYVGNWREVLREMRLLLGLFITAAIALPWYVLVIWRNKTFIDAFFGYHNVERFTAVVNNHSAPWYFYFIVVLVGFAPWSMFLPVAMARVRFWQRRYLRSQPRFAHLGLFALVWFVVIFAFYTVAVTKLPHYVMPAMPAAAILVALLCSNRGIGNREQGIAQDLSGTSAKSLSLRDDSKPIFISGWANVALLLLLGVAMFAIPYFISADPSIPNLSQMLKQSRLPLVGAGIWVGCACIAASLLLRRRWQAVMAVNTFAMLAFIVVVITPTLFLMDADRQIPLRNLSTMAVQTRQPQEEIIMVGFKKPSIVFYAQTQVNFQRRNRDIVKYMQQPTTQNTQPETVLIIAQPKKFPQMGLTPSQYQNISNQSAYQLVRAEKAAFLNLSHPPKDD